MYVDKVLSGIKAVQTLSRLNRAHPKKHDVFVLDFQNDTETIEKSFADYYRTTILSKETDPNKLHTLKGELDQYQVYAPEQVDSLVELYLSGADRDKLDPILDACVAVYVNDLDEDGQVDFKGKAKVFTRTYDFLATILPYGVQDWEKLSIFLNFLISKLPAPIEEDLAKGILEAIDMDSYRAEKQATMAIALPDANAEIEPVPTSGGGRKPEPEMDNSRTSSRRSMTSSADSLMIRRGWRNALLTISRRRFHKIRPTKTRRRTLTGRTPASNTTRRSNVSSPRCSRMTRSSSSSSRTTNLSAIG